MAVLDGLTMHTCVLVADGGNIYDVLDAFSKYDGEPVKPTSKWDYFGIGGRFEGRLRLKKRRMKRLFGVIPLGWTKNVSIATKSEIDERILIENPPSALFYRGMLYECPIFPLTEESLADWDAKFREIFATIPGNTTLQVVDAHS